MQHKLSVLESDLENAEAKLSEAKVGKEKGESTSLMWTFYSAV